MRTTFQDELDLLEATLQEEGALVLRALRGAINALEQRDHELADEVISFDDDVDARYVQIEEGIQSLLARQTPVASDLRLVLAILHVNMSSGFIVAGVLAIIWLFGSGAFLGIKGGALKGVLEGIAAKGADQPVPKLAMGQIGDDQGASTRARPSRTNSDSTSAMAPVQSVSAST